MNEEGRILFVVLEEHYPAKAQELVDGNWQEADPDLYYEVPDDLYFGNDGSEGLSSNIWSNEDGFTVTALSAPGQPPTALEAEAVLNAYREHLAAEGLGDDLTGVVFVYDVDEATEEDE